MIFVTGDTHGDFTRFKTDIFPEQKTMTKADYVIVCGDFGIWNASNEQKYWLDWLEQKPFTTLFVDGNHENYDLLNSYPVEPWQGGNVQFIRPSVIHLMRGQLFEVDGKRIFTMGGASSHDISDGILDPDAPDFKQKRALLDKQGKYMYRIDRLSWWKEELPSKEEYATARSTLEACGWKVDCIFTHCAPNDVTPALEVGRISWMLSRIFWRRSANGASLIIGSLGITTRTGMCFGSLWGCMSRFWSCLKACCCKVLINLC